LSRPGLRGYPPDVPKPTLPAPRATSGPTATHATLAAAGRATNAAVGMATDLATDLVDGVKKSDRPVRLKAAVVGTWLLLTVITIWSACPSTGPRNSLGAVARLQSTSVGQVVSLRNETDGTIWTGVELILDDTWRYDRRRTIRPGDAVTPRVEDFVKDGQPAPATLRPTKLTVLCEQGRVSLPLAERR
jgi:hypothetical protein